jgi:stage V sporulation protein B
MASHANKFFFGTVTVFIFFFLSALLGYATKVIFARELSVDNIGLLYAVLGFVTFFTFIRDFGLSDALVYFIPIFIVDKEEGKIKASIKHTLFVQIITGVVFAALVFMFSGLLADNYFKDPSARMLLIFLSLYFIVDGIIEVLFTSFHGFQDMFMNQAIGFFFQVITFICLIFLISKGMSVSLYGLAYLAAAMVTVVLFSYLFLKRTMPNFLSCKPDYSGDLKKNMKEYANPTMIATMADQVFGQQTIFFLTFFMGIKYVGYYVMAMSLSKITIYFFKAMNMVFFPMMTQLWKKHDIKNLNYYLGQLFSFSYMFGLPISIALIFFANDALEILYGQAFLEGAIVLKISAIYFLFISFDSLMKRVFMSLGKPKLARNLTYITTIINLVLSLLLIPPYGLLGAAIADLASVVGAAILALYYKQKEKDIIIPYLSLLKIIIASSFFVVTLSFFSHIIKFTTYIKLPIVISLAGIIYIFSIFLLKIITFKEVNTILKMLTNNKISLPFMKEEKV